MPEHLPFRIVESVTRSNMSKNDIRHTIPESEDKDKLTAIIPLLADYLSTEKPKGVSVFEPNSLYRKARALMTEAGNTEKDCNGFLQDIVKLYLETGLFVHSTGSLGRQYTGNIPITAVTDLVNSVVNQPSSFYEASQLPCVAEKIMAEELNRFIGFGKDRFAMIETSGGSLANLTALLAARNSHYADCSRTGMAGINGGMRPTIAMGYDVHYSLIRSVNMLGIGRENIVWLPLDGKRRIDASQVPIVLDKARKSGMDIFCMVCSAGTTSTGAVDPLAGLARIAHERGIWLHVDGCHGASLLLSDSLSHKLHGVEQADSLSWDAHKMLFVPSPCSLLFYKDRQKASLAFRESASYVKSDTGEEYGNGELNFECTKRPSIMNLWVAWAIYGRELFASRIEKLCSLCHDAWEMLREQPDFEALHEPEMNILCFRYMPEVLPEGMSDTDFQLAIREAVCRKGRYFISKAKLDDKATLRVVIMNHRHTTETFKELLDEIREVGKELTLNKSKSKNHE